MSARQGALLLAANMATGDLKSQCEVWSDAARLSALVQTMAVGVLCECPNQSWIALMLMLLLVILRSVAALCAEAAMFAWILARIVAWVTVSVRVMCTLLFTAVPTILQVLASTCCTDVQVTTLVVFFCSVSSVANNSNAGPFQDVCVSNKESLFALGTILTAWLGALMLHTCVAVQCGVPLW